MPSHYTTFPLALAGTIASVIFAAMFIYLIAKWSLKRTKELSEKFETEPLTPQQQSDPRIIEINNRINEFKTKYNEATNKGDTRMANIFDSEIKRLQKEKEVLMKKMKQ